jgi:hypothetical protein
MLRKLSGSWAAVTFACIRKREYVSVNLLSLPVALRGQRPAHVGIDADFFRGHPADSSGTSVNLMRKSATFSEAAPVGNGASGSDLEEKMILRTGNSRTK